MTGDLPEAAVRLLSMLPVRTHEQKEPDARKLGRAYTPGDGIFHSGKRVKIGKRIYDTITQARTERKCSSQMIYKMIREGTAEYL